LLIRFDLEIQVNTGIYCGEYLTGRTHHLHQNLVLLKGGNNKFTSKKEHREKYEIHKKEKARKREKKSIVVCYLNVSTVM